MKLLVAKPNGMTGEELQKLASLGFELVLDGEDSKPYTGCRQDIEAIICFRFFDHNDIRTFPSLRVIHLTSAGYDHMPMDYLREKGIALYNARGVYSDAIAEFVLWGVLDLYKKRSFFVGNARERRWQQTGDLRELAGKSVAILGAGSIAAEISRRFRAMGCTVTALCRHPGEDQDFDAVKNAEELDGVLPDTDIMVLAAPLTESTRHIFNRERFEKLRTGALLVNIARGGLVDTDAFIAAIEGGKLSGAVMDVFETEPLPPESPIWDMENVLLTPHNAFAGEFNGHRTFEVMYRDFSQWIDK